MKATTLKKAAILAGSLSFLAGSAFSQTAVSGAGGYTTYDIQPGFNLIGLTLHNPVELTGTVTAVAGTTVTVDQDLGGLAAGSTYILEVTSDGEVTGGDITGAVSVVADATGMNITTADDLSGDLDVGATVQLRAAATLAEVFGTGDDVVINKGTSTTGDTILVTDGQGGFITYWHTEDTQFGAGSWQTAGAVIEDGNEPIIYTDGMYVQNRTQEAYDIVLTGMVKTQTTELGVIPEFSYFSSVYPVGSTLGTSGLADFVRKGTSTTGDVVFMADGSQFWHTEDTQFGAGAWQGTGPSVADPVSDSPISSGFIVQRRADNPYNAPYTPPSFYENL